MNKLEGFYELQRLGIPTVNWLEYSPEVEFDDSILWTVRTAVERGNDFNLPRCVGVPAKRAKEFAEKNFHTLGVRGMIVYYPFFHATKSGTLEISNERTIIEAVADDLWNLTTESNVDVSIFITDKETTKIGKSDFISSEELDQILNAELIIKRRLRSHLLQGKKALLEWSFARDVSSTGEPIGEKYLVFYECRAI